MLLNGKKKVEIAWFFQQLEDVAVRRQDQSAVAADRLLQDFQSTQKLIELRRLAVRFGGQSDHIRVRLSTDLD